MTDAKKLAIVTGAAGGMGKGITRRLVEDGFRVLMSDMRKDALAEAAKEFGSDVDFVAGDVTDPAHRAAVFERADGLFALVNNAGAFWPGGIDELTGDDFRKIMEVNLIAPFEFSKLAVPIMRKNGGGRIVNIASKSYLGSARLGHYSASKGALVSLTGALSMELAADGILVNAIAPGVINTPALNLWNDPNVIPNLAKQIGVGHMGEPADIAHMVSTMASPRNTFLTGQTVLVDGGRAFAKS
jgi:3-oxoacyl-[acyl-carrier protein] reductase|tara:strand:+ start:6007 stop:6735 length:729 start_codon:yes stop_codon:yes gene_type:complete